MSEHDELDFVGIKARFDSQLTLGQRAELRRVRDPDDLAMVPAYYRLLPKGVASSRQWRRVAFLLPHVAHREEAGNVGQSLARARISEMRIFQMARAASNTVALQHLRRLCRHAKAVLDWDVFGRTLFYWGDNAKRRIVEDYFANIRGT